MPRLYLRPIQDEAAFRMYKEQQNCLWSAEEVGGQLKRDLADYERMDPEQQRWIRYVLSFFLIADALVMSLLDSLPQPDAIESRMFLAIQSAIEAVHMETYSLWAETIVPANNSAELHQLIASSPAIQAKRDWILSFCHDPNPAVQVLGLCCSEGINFASVFAAFFFLRTKNQCQGLTFANALIWRDESLHMRHGCHWYRQLKDKLPRKQVMKIVQGAVEAEHAFVKESVVEVLGLSQQDMLTFVEYMADFVLDLLGEDKHYGVDQPFHWLDLASAQSMGVKTNFFEATPSEYAKASVAGTARFSTEDDF